MSYSSSGPCLSSEGNDIGWKSTSLSSHHDLDSARAQSTHLHAYTGSSKACRLCGSMKVRLQSLLRADFSQLGVAWQDGGDNRYKCRLCTKEFPNWVTISNARARARDLDRPPPATFLPGRATAEHTEHPLFASRNASAAPEPDVTNFSTFPKFRAGSHITIPGPRCPSDPPDQIYVDSGGEWSRMRTSLPAPEGGVVELDLGDSRA